MQSKSYARYALLLLTCVNLLNYIDRQVLYAVFPLIKADWGLSDTALGFLGSAFMLCYMVSAPFIGWLGDRGNRVALAASGVAVWSLATAASGFAVGYKQLLAARTAVGIGEASFGTVSPSLLSDFFPKERRGRILAYFYLAIPVGSALGYLFGGLIGHHFGWHAAFLMAGLPGILLALLLWFLREPKHDLQAHLIPPASPDSDLLDSELKTQNSEIKTEANSKSKIQNSKLSGYISFFSNRSFVVNTLAMAAMTFALGGLAQWVPTFLFRVHHLDVGTANTLFGGITVVAGIGGTLAGGWLGDYVQKKTPKGYLLVSGWGFLIGAPVAAYALHTPSLTLCMAAMFVAEFFLFFNTGPLNTVIINVVAPGLRAMAFAVNIFFIHFLGDAFSPTIIGWLSDLWNLRTALLTAPLAIVAAGLFCFLCSRYITDDMAKVDG